MNQKLLHAKLIDFGLNPADWMIELREVVAGVARLAILPIRDDDLILEGWAQGQSWLVLSYQG